MRRSLRGPPGGGAERLQKIESSIIKILLIKPKPNEALSERLRELQGTFTVPPLGTRKIIEQGYSPRGLSVPSAGRLEARGGLGRPNCSNFPDLRRQVQIG